MAVTLLYPYEEAPSSWIQYQYHYSSISLQDISEINPLSEFQLESNQAKP